MGREPRKTPRRNRATPRLAGALIDFCDFLAFRGVVPGEDLLAYLRVFAEQRKLDLHEADALSWWMDPRQRYQVRKKESGCCIICGKPAVNATHCEDREADRQRWRAKKQK
jgi:hypothetical protein